MRTRTFFITIVIVLFLAALATGGYYYWRNAHPAAASAVYQTPEETSDVYVRFDMEAYDTIQQNYWQKASDADLSAVFFAAMKQASGADISLATSTRSGVAQMLEAGISTATSTDEKKQFTLQTLQLVISALAPQGRSELLTSSAQQQLDNTVNNVNPSTDLYQQLGVAKGASAAVVNTAYQQQSAALAASSSPAAKKQLQAVAYAHEVLTNPTDKQMYDTTQAEPTVFAHVLGSTLYLYVKQISPTTLQEFAIAVDNASTTPLSSMVLDFRGNIGGDLAFAQAFIGLFIGSNQYAFDLFHQGDYQAQRTTEPQFSELARYTEIAVLTDDMTQSTAELTTAALKRFRIAYSVGATTRGWGSVEGTYPLKTVIDPNETYALLLVNSLDLREDNQPIESNGVPADVNIADKNWKSELGTYFRSGSIISAIETAFAKGPLK